MPVLVGNQGLWRRSGRRAQVTWFYPSAPYYVPPPNQHALAQPGLLVRLLVPAEHGGSARAMAAACTRSACCMRVWVRPRSLPAVATFARGDTGGARETRDAWEMRGHAPGSPPPPPATAFTQARRPIPSYRHPIALILVPPRPPMAQAPALGWWGFVTCWVRSF